MLLTQCLENSVTHLFEKEIGGRFPDCPSNYQSIFSSAIFIHQWYRYIMKNNESPRTISYGHNEHELEIKIYDRNSE